MFLNVPLMKRASDHWLIGDTAAVPLIAEILLCSQKEEVFGLRLEGP